MNTTVAIVLPAWMVWLVAVICILQVIETTLRIYANHLRTKRNKP